ncbi:putative mitochondrial cytochrome b2 [Thelonectria olida]|uniref:Mitochondrial cytochrome b2 n=1 Tax=Thelonectria olida TaxID=1576542 RepID=A0A9P9AS99_9HYPO|nr:putative mitochondrial cytochrome b2 [Thelonectria olida]
MTQTLAFTDVSQHDKTDDIWIVVNGSVYDMTDFAPVHPGGPDIIYRYAGRDASDMCNAVHAPSLIRKSLDEKFHIGDIDPSSIPEKNETSAEDTNGSNGSHAVPLVQPDAPDKDTAKPPLSSIINLYDFEHAAAKTISKKSWAYISSASNDCITRDANVDFLQRIWFRPSVMRDVSTINTKTRLFGCDLDFPVYVTPMGGVKSAGVEGELALAKGAAEAGVVQCIATPSAYPYAEVIEATAEQAFFQLYVLKDRARCEMLVKMVTQSPKIKAIFVTADSPVISKREEDERAKPEDLIPTSNDGQPTLKKDWKGAGMARQAASFIDPSLEWEDVAWLRTLTSLPIVVKGIQRWEDAKLAMEHGCEGIVLSNHGGRAADTAQPAILLLLELHMNCPEVFQSMEVLIDGGFRRGSDAVKAICLGASAVGVGRPLFYAVNYGTDGVAHALNIVRDEMETAMRLCGISDLMKHASPEYVNTSDIDKYVIRGGHPYARKILKRGDNIGNY